MNWLERLSVVYRDDALISSKQVRSETITATETRATPGEFWTRSITHQMTTQG